MKRKVFMMIIAAFLMTVSWLTYDFITNKGKVNVKVVVAPADAIISINDQVYRQKTIKLLPNTAYQVTIMRDGFNDQNFDLKTTSQQQFPTDNMIYGSLTPLTDWAKDLKQKNIHEYQLIEGIVGNDIDQQINARIKQFPIIKHLPLMEQDYHIGHYQQTSELIITVYGNHRNFIHAINHLRLFDKDLSKYRIEFYDRDTKRKINNLFEEYIKNE